MELNLTAGRAGAGKSRFCTEQIAALCAADPENRVFLIVPEQFTIQAERRLLETIPSGGVLNNEVLSFKRLTHRVLSQYGGVGKKVLDLSGRSMVLSHAFRACRKQLVYYRDSCRNIWDTDKVMNLITELVRYGVSPEELAAASEKFAADEQTKELETKLRELSLIYGKYKQLLNTEYMDALDLHRVLIEKLEEEKPFRDAVIWIDEFTGFTTLELEIIECLVRQCASVNICLLNGKKPDQTFYGVQYTIKLLAEIGQRCGCGHTMRYLEPEALPRFSGNPALAVLEREFGCYPCRPYGEVPENIRICSCADLHQEVYNSALEIQRLCTEEGLRFRELSVTVRDLGAYKNIIAAIYPLMGISFFMDDRMSLDRHPLTACILDALDIIAGNWRYDSVFSFLKSGYYALDRAALNRLENYVLAFGIRGRSAWKKTVPDPECEAIRAAFMQRTDVFYEELRQAGTYKEGLMALCRFLDCLQIGGDSSEEGSPDAEIWEMITRVFGQLCDFLGEQPCGGIAGTAEELKALLRSGFAKHTVGAIPADTDCVQVGAADRSRTHEIEALLVLGANEGVFPASFRDDGILSDRERDRLREKGIPLSETMQTRAFLEQFLIYRTLTSPKKHLYISYAMDTGGGSGRPSWLIRRVRTILPKAVCRPGEPIAGFGPAEKLKKVSHTEAALSPAIARALFTSGRDMIASVSGMETYQSCPYRFFLEKGLLVRKREKYSVESLDTGSLLHLLLEYGARRLTEMGGWQKVSQGDCEKIVREAAPEALAVHGNQAMTGSARNLFLTERLLRFAARSLYAMSEQSRESAYIPGGYEVKFGYRDPGSLPALELEGKDGDPIRLRGKIDRYDCWDRAGSEYFRIIDYKSSLPKIEPGSVYDGYTMQLVAYMDALESAIKAEGKVPVCGGVFYFVIPSDRTKKPDYRLKGLVYEDEDNLDAMAGPSGKGGLSYTSKNVTGCAKVPDGGFAFLKKRVRENISEITDRICRGEIPIRPVRRNDEPTCKYCGLRDVCGFSGVPLLCSFKKADEVWDLKNKGI